MSSMSSMLPDINAKMKNSIDYEHDNKIGEISYNHNKYASFVSTPIVAKKT
mgnify:CR=1 FL=1